MTPGEARTLLADLLHPHSIEHFTNHILDELAFSILARGRMDLGDRLLGRAPMQALEAMHSLVAPRAVLHAQMPTAPAPPLFRAASLDEFKEALRESGDAGYTIQFCCADTIFPELARVRAAFDHWYAGTVETDVFWSAPGCSSRGHADMYDGLVIQVQGTKRWRLAREHGGLPNRWPLIPPNRPEPGELKTIDLVPGDVLYVRRGQYHEVSSLTEPTLHLAIAFRPMTARDVVAAVLDYVADQDLRWRWKQLPGHPVPLWEGGKRPDLANIIRQLMPRLQSALSSEGEIEKALVWSRSRALAARPEARPQAEVGGNLNGTYRLKRELFCSLRSVGDRVILTGPGRHLVLPVSVEPALRAILQQGSFVPDELPGKLSRGTRQLITRRLGEMGLVELDEP